MKEHVLAYFALALLWAVAIGLAWPLGNFPLNDDWAYANDVRHLTETGILILDDWPAMTRIAQIFWGAVFVKMAGFSYEVLRFSTIVLGYVGLMAAWFTFMEAGADKRSALLASAVIALNPLYFSLSLTFMTDVPFLAFFLLSVFFFVKSARTGLLRHVAWGAFFALLATLVRQTGIAVTFAFAVVWLLKSRRPVLSLPVAFAPLAICVTAYAVFTAWLEAAQGLPASWGSAGKLLARVGDADFLEISAMRLGILTCYMGLFLLPFTMMALHSRWQTAAPVLRWRAVGLAALAVAAIWLAWPRLPWGNVVYNFGIGPKTLKDGVFSINVSPVLGTSLLGAVKLLAAAGGVLFVVHFALSFFGGVRSDRATQLRTVFLLVLISAYGGFLLLDKFFFDRYFLVLVPLCLYCMIQDKGDYMPESHVQKGMAKVEMAMALVLLLGIGSFSVTATHDYLAWNRARWLALDYLTRDKNIPPDRIDGGFEFNGLHKPGPKDSGGGKSWWWVDRDDYAVTFGDMPGFSKEKAFPYTRWLPPGRDSIFVLKRNEGD